MVDAALRLAKTKHEGQQRKFSSEPYVVHPIRVARIAMRYKDTSNPEIIKSACVLHDVVEDTDASLDLVAEVTNYTVAGIVEEVTSDGDGIERLGKAEYLAREMIDMSTYALVVKLCDRKHNTNDLYFAPNRFAQRYARETKHVLWRLREGRGKLTDSHRRLMRSIWYNVNSVT